MIGTLRRLLRRYHSWKEIVWDEKTDFTVPFSAKVRYALRGFSANEYVWYRLDRNDYREYISEYERLKSREINGQYKFILDNKLIFEEVFGKYARVPQNYALICDGTVYALHDFPVNNDNIEDFLRQSGRTILKWLDRGGGSGTYFLEAQGSEIKANGEVLSQAELRKILSREGKALLCEYMTQSDFSASLYPYTTNTIRIVCARKKGEKEAKIIAAVQRIGCKASIPVDNFCSGGMTCDIDLNTGVLSHGISRLGEMDRRMKKFDFHPDTGAQITGKRIPDWETIKSGVLALTNKVPYLNFVAWDVLLTPEGYCIIEGNASSGCGIFQMEHGVRGSALGDIYRSYGVIQ